MHRDSQLLRVCVHMLHITANHRDKRALVGIHVDAQWCSADVLTTRALRCSGRRLGLHQHESASAYIVGQFELFDAPGSRLVMSRNWQHMCCANS